MNSGTEQKESFPSPNLILFKFSTRLLITAGMCSYCSVKLPLLAQLWAYENSVNSVLP